MMKSRQRFGVALVLALMAALLSVGVSPAGATNIGEEGCTPGYWKNHTDNWFEDEANTVRSYSTGDLFGDVFGVDYDVSLLAALQGGGGGGIAGAHKILARAATAAALNAAHEGLGYPLRREADIFPAVQAVWDSGDRDAILDLASELDRLNNLGCPLN